jgi:hypothetical protein
MIKYTLILLVLIINSCVVRDTSNALGLSENTLKEHHKNIKDLYEHWIQPESKLDTYGFHKVKLGSTQEWYDAQDSIKNGFDRFCTLKAGKLQFQDRGTGFVLTCLGSDTKLIGKLMLQRFEDNILRIEYDSFERQQLRHKAENEFKLLKTFNGPTGTLTTTDGKQFQFLRIGNFKEPHILHVELSNKPYKEVKLENIKRIEFLDNGLDVRIVTQEGNAFVVNEASIVQKKEGYSISGGDLSVVLIDPASNQAYTKLYPWFNGIKKIVIDPKEKWEKKKTEVIKSKFNADSTPKCNSRKFGLSVEKHLMRCFVSQCFSRSMV